MVVCVCGWSLARYIIGFRLLPPPPLFAGFVCFDFRKARCEDFERTRAFLFFFFSTCVFFFFFFPPSIALSALKMEITD